MNRWKRASENLVLVGKALPAVLLAMFALGLSDTARAQSVTLTASPLQLTFNNVPQSSVSAPQTVSVTSNVATTVIVQPSQGSSWLVVSPGGGVNVGTSPTNLSVIANTAGLSLGTYQGSFTLTVSGQTAPQVTVSVTLTVGSTSTGNISANPSTLSFTAQQGSSTASPASTTVQITTTGASFSYNLTATTTGGGTWLLLDRTSGTTGDAGFNVSVNPSGLVGGTYNGTIVAQSTTTSDSIRLPVTLTINSNASITVTPANPPPFLYQINSGTLPSAQTLAVTATNGSLPFSIQAPNVSWLVVSPLSGVASATPTAILLSASPSNLAAGTYFANVVIVPSNGTPNVTVPVSLVISPNALLTVSTNALNYTAQFAGQPPADQTVSVTATGTGSSVAFTYSSDSTWLSATSNVNNSPATLTVHVNQSSLTVGSYTGHITVRPADGENYSQVITVSLTVANATSLTAAPPLLLFSYQIGQVAPGAQTVQIASTGAQTSFSAPQISTSNCGSNWLSAVALANTAPSVLNVSVVVTGLSAGICTGSITIPYSASQSLVIPVTLAVTTTPQLSVSLPAGFGVYSLVPDGSMAAQRISLTSTDPNTQVSFTANSPSTFISLASSVGNTPSNLVVNISAVGLTPGIYQGQIVISSANLPNNSLIIPVSLTVTPNTVVSVTPPGTVANPISFSQPQGGSPPAAQVLTMSSTGGTATYAATINYNNGSGWLQVSPTSGNASGPLTLTIAANSLSQGTYNAQVVLALQNASTSTLTINVSLNITAPQSLTVTPNQTFAFTYQKGSASQPASQVAHVTSSGGAIKFQVATTSSGWLSADVTSGTTPQDVNLQVNAANLAVSSTPYNGSVTISATGVPSVTLNVTLTVTAPPAPSPVMIVNSASGVAGVIAPGEIITIFGANLGPASPAKGTSFVLNSAGGVDNTLAGVQVLFGPSATSATPGIPLFVSSTQINVIVPFGIAGQATTSVFVQYQGGVSAPFTFTVAQSAPGIYTLNSQGFGQAAAVNQNGTYNGTGANGTTYASQDSVVLLYATGGGQTTPASTAGTVTPIGATLYKVPNVTATVGGQPAVVEFAGGAPGLVAGVIQLNVHVPKGVTGDALPVVITVGPNSSPLTGTNGQGPTIAVR